MKGNGSEKVRFLSTVNTLIYTNTTQADAAGSAWA